MPPHTSTRTPTPRARRALLAAALFVFPFLPGSPSAAQPAEGELEAARERLAAASERLGALVEWYDQTKLAVEHVSARLAEFRTVMDEARARAEEATSQLHATAAEAYKNPVSPLVLLLSSTSTADLRARIQFLDTVAQIHRDTAVAARVQGERARRAAERVEHTLAEQRDLLRSLDDQRTEIERDVAAFEAEVARLEEATQEPVVFDLTSSGPPPAPLPEPATLAPPVASDAAGAIAAAESVIGTPYQYGGSSPQGGFDCSGLTMWSWGQAGVSLPHSSAAQYEALPHVDRSELQPGDLVFFYNPIHHVGLYVGGGMMIDSPHTGTEVQRRAVQWDVYVGAARPG
jgi:cell wall-associated NlpC family hydrolase